MALSDDKKTEIDRREAARRTRAAQLEALNQVIQRCDAASDMAPFLGMSSLDDPQRQ